MLSSYQLKLLSKVFQPSYLSLKKGIFYERGPYTERIDLWFEPFFVKETRRVVEWLREMKTAYPNIVINFF